MEFTEGDPSKQARIGQLQHEKKATEPNYLADDVEQTSGYVMCWRRKDGLIQRLMDLKGHVFFWAVA